MIKLLAPTTLDSADEGTTAILEMDRPTFLALAVAVEVAFDDPESTPDAHKVAAADLWKFFVNGEQTAFPIREA